MVSATNAMLVRRVLFATSTAAIANTAQEASFEIPVPSSALITVVVIGVVVGLILAVLVLPIHLLRITVSSDEITVSAPLCTAFQLSEERSRRFSSRT